MHPSAMYNAKLFFETYASNFAGGKILEIGSQDVNGSIRDVAPKHLAYTGADFVEGKGVDVIISDPYHLPFPDQTFDIIVSNSCFEHSEMFWLLFLDVIRMLKPNGLLYLNAPSNGDFHRYPVDCWRFYPDSGRALVTWAKHNGKNPALLESFTGKKLGGIWNDYVAVFVADLAHANQHQVRMMDRTDAYENGQKLGDERVFNQQLIPDDQRNVITTFMRRIWRKRERQAYQAVVG